MSPLGTMANALLYLRVTSLIGRVKSRLARLKQPKYLAGAVVGAAYVYLTFVRRVQPPHVGYSAGVGGAALPLGGVALFSDIGAVLVLLILVANWATPRSASLAFSEAEIAFLFPAPVNRRMLVHYRLLGAQLGLVFTALILSLVFGRGRGFGGNPWFHAIGWWLILATINLHFTGTAFVYSRVLNRSLTSARRTAITVGLVWLTIAALAAWACAAFALPQRAQLASVAQFAVYLAAQLHTGPLPWLLAVPKLLVAPYFAASGAAFARALWPALLVLVAHYFWVVHTEVSFEEASIARAQKRAARAKAVQGGDWRGAGAARKAQRPPFRLAEQGRPELAFLWKNLLSTSTLFRPRVAMVLVAVVAVGSQWLVHQPQLAGLRIFALTVFGAMLGVTLVFGPIISRQDLRRELPNVDLLKAYPLRGWQIVAGEILTPLVILSAVAWLCLLAVLLLWPAETATWIDPALRVAAALAVAVLAPPLLAIELLVSNAAAVLFPAWTQATGNRADRGIEVMGQRIIFTSAQLLLTVIAAVPAVFSAGLTFLIAQWLIGTVAAGVLAGSAALLVLAIEVWLGVRWLGGRFEDFDLSTELRA